MDATLTKIQKGLVVEKAVSNFLIQQGMICLVKNYRCPFGEIDLIMRDQNEFVFVEVRSRKSLAFGSPVESVNRIKQKKIIKCALYYLQQCQLLDKVACRFDVVGVANQTFEWIKNAFYE